MIRLVLSALCLASAGIVCASEVRLKGWLGDRLDAMIARHVAAADVIYLTAPFVSKAEKDGCWQAEFWGKYMHSAIPYLRYARSPELRDKVEVGLDRILASQVADGYIGICTPKYRCEDWDVWGMKYTLLGLLHYYEGTRSGTKDEIEKGDAALGACRRLCDYVIAEVGPNGRHGKAVWQTGFFCGMASSSILEPVVWLYRRTGDAKYLDFAAFVVKGMTEPVSGPRLVDLALADVPVADRNGHGNVPGVDGRFSVTNNRWKAYEMMSCYHGLLDFVQVKSEELRVKSYKDDPLFVAAVKAAEDIAAEEVNLAGGCTSAEAWFHGARKQHLPYRRQQETCVTTTWMRLCQRLLALTGDPKWADRIERTFYNAYLASLSADGSRFASYTPLSGNRSFGQHHCAMHMNCCNANGPRGFLCFLDELFRVKDGAAVFNFYSSAQVSGTLPDGRRVAFDMYSLYPRGDSARIVSHTEGALPLKLRIPAWAAGTSVLLNGNACPDVKAGEYYVLNRVWELGDVIEVRFDMPVVAHVRERHVAFTRGPVLLARDNRFADGEMSEPLAAGQIADGQLIPDFRSVCVPSDDFWMTFSCVLPFGGHSENPEGKLPTSVMFCDYASAGNAWTRENAYRTWFDVEIGPDE